MDVYASESTKRMAAKHQQDKHMVFRLSSLPAKKLLFPDPFRPTTTLCLEENGSICVWSLSAEHQRSAQSIHEQGSHDLKPWIVNVLMYMLNRGAAPMNYDETNTQSTVLMSLKPIAVQPGQKGSPDATRCRRFNIVNANVTVVIRD